MSHSFKTANTILYCRNWRETVDFYRFSLQLPVSLATDWFMEFRLTDTARLSLADERRASVKSAAGAGITLTLQVESADATWRELSERGLSLEPLRDHPWGARVFYLFDPEGHRVEIWSADSDV